MSAFTGHELADHIYYKKLPEIYNIKDAQETEKKDLYRYLHAVVEGAFNDTLEQAAAMTDLIDPWKCPVEYLPYMYWSFGLPYFEDIGEYYNRRFLSDIGELLKRRGTIGGVRYLVRVLTGMESSISYERVMNDKEHSRYLHVYPNFPDVTSLAEVEVTAYTINRFLQLHLPFYIRSIFFPSIETTYLNTNIHNEVSFAHILTQYLFNERDRTLRIDNHRMNVLDYKANIDLNKGYKLQKIETCLKYSAPTSTKALSYDLTQLKGKKISSDYTTNGNRKFNIDNRRATFLQFLINTQDLSQSQSIKITKKFIHVICNCISKAIDLTDYKKYNILITERNFAIKNSLLKSYDLTRIDGSKDFREKNIKKSYNLKVVSNSYIVYNLIKNYDLTSLQGKRIVDYTSRYNHNYYLKINIRQPLCATSTKRYGLDKEIQPRKVGGNKISNTSFCSIIQYDLRGDKIE